MISSYLSSMQDIKRGFIPPFDFHMHTKWTDGAQSAQEMHAQAIAQGLKYILFSEHARKTSGSWFNEFAAEVRALPKDQCLALVGVESKVDDFDGSIDINHEVLQTVDMIMASVHRFPGETGNVMGKGKVTGEEAINIEYRLIMAVLENPDVDILGHPFGMSHRRFGVSVPDRLFKEVIAKAAKTGVAVEINSHYHTNPWELVDWCQEAGALISLGSNAHNVSEVGRIKRVLEGSEVPWQMLES